MKIRGAGQAWAVGINIAVFKRKFGADIGIPVKILLQPCQTHHDIMMQDSGIEMPLCGKIDLMVSQNPQLLISLTFVIASGTGEVKLACGKLLVQMGVGIGKACGPVTGKVPVQTGAEAFEVVGFP